MPSPSTIVALKPHINRAAFLARAQRAGVALQPVPGLDRHFVAHGVTPADFRLASDPAVMALDDGEQEVQPDTQAITIPVSLVGGSWPLARIIRRDPPWDTRRLRHPINTFFTANRTGAGVDFYTLDTGIRISHAEFGGRATNVYEYYSSAGAGDDVGHGTPVASAAIGATVGLAREALAWSFKMLTVPGAINTGGTGTNLSLITALGEALLHYHARAATNRPAVMGLSLRGFGATVNSAVSAVIDAGVITCVSAGNNRQNLDVVNVYPAESDPDLIVVGGLGMADIPYYNGNFGTNFGSSVAILAPAQSCRLAHFVSDASFNTFTGTSFAAPYTAGVIACMMQGRSRLTTRAQVQAVRAELLAAATTGRLVPQPHFGIGALPDRILYIDPRQAA